jgi:hypothetical protein
LVDHAPGEEAPSPPVVLDANRLSTTDFLPVRLALVLGTFYLSNDSRALRAVYGLDADLREHAKWLEVLEAGGDAGELGRMFHVAIVGTPPADAAAAGPGR